MTTAGVANVAGQPQRREALATPGGRVEVWYYVIAGARGALLEHPVVFANNQVVATGREAMQALLNAQQTAQTQPGREVQEREEAARNLARFYEKYPILKGREKCVGRALNTLADKTWDNLARVAISFCVAPPPPLEDQTAWVKVSTGADGRSTFVDLSRIEVRQGHQITFWQLVEFFDDEDDFILYRTVADCDRKLFSLIHSESIVSGRYGTGGAAPIEWQSVLPNSKGEAVLAAACAARTALTKPPAPARPAQTRRDFSKPEI